MQNKLVKIKDFINKTPVLFRCALAGICIAGSVPPWGWWPLAFVGIALLDHLIANQPWKKRFLRVFLIAVFWLYSAMLWMWDMTPPGYLVAGSLLALFFATAAALTPADWRRRFVLPGAIALAEVARWSWPFGGIPLANLALGQVDSPIIYSAKIGGSLLVIVLTVIVGQSLSALFEYRNIDKALSTVIIGMTVVSGFILGGYMYPKGEVVKEINVALVQGGGPQNTRASIFGASKVLQRHIEATRAVDPDVELIIWPENVVNPNGTNQWREYRQTVKQEVAQKYNATLLSGWFYPISDDTTVNYQSSIDPQGVQLDRYDKVKLVPFGEVVPFRSLIERFSSELPSRDVQVGTADPILDTPVGPVGVSISWEGYFDVSSRSAVQNGAQILTNPTNGASYWLTQVQTQQVAANQLHAIENDRWVLQVAPTGLSAIIDPNGDVVQRSDVSEQIVLQQKVEMRSSRTLASKYGFWPVAVYAIFALLTSRLRLFRRS